jgi:hypothetical protein
MQMILIVEIFLLPSIPALPYSYKEYCGLQQVENFSSLTKKSRALTKLIAFTFKTKQEVSKKLF